MDETNVDALLMTMAWVADRLELLACQVGCCHDRHKAGDGSRGSSPCGQQRFTTGAIRSLAHALTGSQYIDVQHRARIDEILRDMKTTRCGGKVTAT